MTMYSHKKDVSPTGELFESKFNLSLTSIKTNVSRADDFAHDDQYSNFRYSYILNQTQALIWNRKETGFIFSFIFMSHHLNRWFCRIPSAI